MSTPLQLHPNDNVGIITPPGSKSIPAGHKIALCDIGAGAPVLRYGQVIGVASAPIAAGEHVHTHNLQMNEASVDLAICSEVAPTEMVPESDRKSFMGYLRPTGRVGTRNHVAVIGVSNCAAHTCREIAAHFTADRLRSFPNVDGVIALTHSAGCGGGQQGTEDHEILQRTLAGMITHPNVAASIVVGLGCEYQQADCLLRSPAVAANPGPAPAVFTIQECGGIAPTIQAGVSAVEELLPRANLAHRTRQPVSELCLALECGGSDGWSGITANPLVGRVADAVIRHGGAAVLSETTEIFGAEHLLTRRTATPEVARKLLDRLDWWRDYLTRNGQTFDNNPSPGNKAGGLTNIVEKSLGAIAKGGTTNLVDVLKYAEPVTESGFLVMDTPGYDPVSVTGKVAGGCNLVLFTTGRGSALGFRPAPGIKIASNTEMYNRMSGDMDFNSGRLMEAGTMEALSDELLDLVVAVASGEPSKSEAQGVGSEEFVPWQPGPVL